MKLMKLKLLVSEQEFSMTEYEYGLHCGDKDCYSCGTQRYVCKELDRLDSIADREEHESMD